MASRCVNGGRSSVERRTNGLRAVIAGRQSGGLDGDGARVENRAGDGVSGQPRWQVGGDRLGVQVRQRRAVVSRAANQRSSGGDRGSPKRWTRWRRRWGRKPSGRRRVRSAALAGRRRPSWRPGASTAGGRQSRGEPAVFGR